MHLHLIDGSGYIFRAFFGLPPMQRSDGLPCNAIHGYCGMLGRLLRQHEGEPPTHIAVVLDAGRANHRHAIYPEYKAHRPTLHEALVPQLPLIRAATKAFSVTAIEKPGFEADDLIATYARMAAEAGGEVTIISADKDLMQLVGGTISMLRPIYAKDQPPGLQRFRAEDVEARYGVPPERLTDLLALMGDTSDNIPGVPKVGEKTAAKLIREFGDLDTLLENLERVTPDRIRLALEANVDEALLSRKLVRLVDNVPEVEPLSALERRELDCATLCAFLEEMEFRTLADEFREMLEAA